MGSSRGTKQSTQVDVEMMKGGKKSQRRTLSAILGTPIRSAHLHPNDVHVHPIIHHTPNVKLITARGHHLAAALIKEIDSGGVRKSALAVDAAHNFIG